MVAVCLPFSLCLFFSTIRKNEQNVEVREKNAKQDGRNMFRLVNLVWCICLFISLDSISNYETKYGTKV